jgi:potassium channel subfamily K
MNDPGLHEPTQEAAQDVEKNEREEDEEAEQEEQEYLDPRCVLPQIDTHAIAV